MSVGMIFFALAALLFFLTGIGVSAIPNPQTWGLCCLLAGILFPKRVVP